MTTEGITYQPFSNSTEFDIWYERNCQRCSKCNIDDAPGCPGDEALTLALFDAGRVSVTTCDFIGTTDRRTQDNGLSFCTLNRVCNHLEQRF